jgi:precorrin-3B methylase
MALKEKYPFDIYIVGLGIVGTRQITKEVDYILKKSDHVFLLFTQNTMHDYITNEIGTEVTDLHEEYEEGSDRFDTYRRMADRVLNNAKNTNKSITHAPYGHPSIFVSPTRLIQEEGPKHGLRVKVVPGISAIDCIFAEIGLDPGTNGVQMYEASDFLLRKFEPNPYVPLFLWQIGAIETGLYSMKKSKPERFSRIRQYLESFYPKSHILYLLRTATYPFTNSEQHGFQLKNFEKQHYKIDPVHTLYIPPVDTKEVADKDLANNMVSKAHLNKIVENS